MAPGLVIVLFAALMLEKSWSLERRARSLHDFLRVVPDRVGNASSFRGLAG